MNCNSAGWARLVSKIGLGLTVALHLAFLLVFLIRDPDHIFSPPPP